jgi:hypothetical protein
MISFNVSGKRKDHDPLSMKDNMIAERAAKKCLMVSSLDY